MQFPVSIELRRSKFLTLLLFFFHTSAVGCVLILPWPWVFRFVPLALIVVSAWQSLRPSRIAGIHLSSRDGLNCFLKDGTRVFATIVLDSTVFVGLVVLRLRLDGEKKVSNLTLLPDQMTAEQFRVLRLWLRWHSETKTDDATVF